MTARPVRSPVEPPIAPMLGKLVRELPRGEFVYEPKWDGFRCLAFRDGDRVELRSRNDRPLGRYFPELVAAVSELIDWAQNSERRSMIAPYSLRANVVPLVSAPVSWEEVDGGAESLWFGPAEALERIERLGDLLEPALREVQTVAGLNPSS